MYSSGKDMRMYKCVCARSLRFFFCSFFSVIVVLFFFLLYLIHHIPLSPVKPLNRPFLLDRCRVRRALFFTYSIEWTTVNEVHFCYYDTSSSHPFWSSCTPVAAETCYRYRFFKCRSLWNRLSEVRTSVPVDYITFFWWFFWNRRVSSKMYCFKTSFGRSSSSMSNLNGSSATGWNHLFALPHHRHFA